MRGTAGERIDLTSLLDLQADLRLSEKIFRTTLIIVTGLAGVVFIYTFSLLSRVTPYADEWLMVLYQPKPLGQFTAWLFTQHNDHRLVIQKLIQQSILYMNGYDFRILTAINTLMMLIAAWLLIETIRLLRGTSSLLDLIAISSFCALGSNAVWWSGSFAFPATNLSIIAAAHAWALQLRRGSSSARRWYALIAIGTGPLISAGGLVASTAMMLFIGMRRYIQRDLPSPLGNIGLAAIAIVCLIAWFFYVPSGATGINLDRVGGWAIGMTGGSMYLTRTGYDHAKDIFMIFVVLLGASTLLYDVLKDSTAAQTTPIAMIFFVSFAVACCAAVGRSANQVWYPELKNHYGLVTAPLVPTVAITLWRKRYFKTVAVAILLLSFFSYERSFMEVTNYLTETREQNHEMLERIIHSERLEATLREHWLDYWYRDDDYWLQDRFAREAEYLQRYGGRQYRSKQVPAVSQR